MTGKFTHRDYARLAASSDEELLAACTVQVFRSTGPGGQGVNTTDSAVCMTHVPTGVTVTARETRSQHRNRMLCLAKLRRIFAERARPPKRRVKTKVPKGEKRRRLEDKRRRSERKQLRRRVEGE